MAVLMTHAITHAILTTAVLAQAAIALVAT
jgi:hypothetical protein